MSLGIPDIDTIIPVEFRARHSSIVLKMEMLTNILNNCTQAKELNKLAIDKQNIEKEINELIQKSVVENKEEKKEENIA